MEIYLDSAATTKPCPEAVRAMTEAMTENWGNPSALHRRGLLAEKAVKQARQQVASALGCAPEQVYFTSGGTEGDNLAIFSAVKKNHKRGNHIVATAIEHHGVLNPMKELEAQGFSVTYLKPDHTGTVSPEALEETLRKDTILVSVMMVNNETGALQDISRMAAVVRKKSPAAIFHTDAVQGFLKVPFRCKDLGADIVTVSSHKIHGPKGVGAVYVDKKLHLPPLLYGGGQEKGLRSGTENVPGILGFGAACEAAQKGLGEKLKTMEARKQQLLDALESQVPQAEVLGSHQAPHVVSLAVPGIRSQGLIGFLEQREIYVSAGSACAKGHRSHVLEAMDISPELIDGSIRVSLSYETSRSEIEAFITALGGAIGALS